MNDYFLIFNSHFDRDAGLDFGRLSLNSLSLGTVHIWLATSSHRTLQGRESFHVRGGYLPPQYRVPGLPNWRVNLDPIDLSHNVGCRGNFYIISPTEVRTDRGGVRSDFGIHFDANAPGSLGCIVMSSARWSDFETKMNHLREKNISELPLFVFYS